MTNMEILTFDFNRFRKSYKWLYSKIGKSEKWDNLNGKTSA